MDLPYIVTSNGNTYFRRRACGASFSQGLPSPRSRHFQRAYRSGVRQFETLLNPPTVQRIVRDYELDERYRRLKQSTQRVKGYHLSIISERYGDLMVSEITRHDVFDLREEFRDRPGSAEALVREFCAFLNCAVERGIITENVASDIRKHRDGELRAWPQHVLDKALDAANPMMRLAITTALESGQRICDWIGVTHAQVETGLVELVQRKTGTQVFIPAYAHRRTRWSPARARLPRRKDCRGRASYKGYKAVEVGSISY